MIIKSNIVLLQNGSQGQKLSFNLIIYKLINAKWFIINLYANNHP